MKTIACISFTQLPGTVFHQGTVSSGRYVQYDVISQHQFSSYGSVINLKYQRNYESLFHRSGICFLPVPGCTGAAQKRLARVTDEQKKQGLGWPVNTG